MRGCIGASNRHKKISMQEYFSASSMYLLQRFINLMFCYQGSIIPSAGPSLGVEKCSPIPFE